MGVGILRGMLHEAAIRFAVLRDEGSARLLEETAEQFGVEKRRSRIRREKWKERKEARQTVGDGFNICRVRGCDKSPGWRPVLLFPPLDGGPEKIRVETAMLDVCENHARMLGPEVYTENPDVWRAVSEVFANAGVEPPDPDLAEVIYVKRTEAKS